MTIALNQRPTALTGWLSPGLGADLIATSTGDNWPGTTALEFGNDDPGLSILATVDGLEARWTLTPTQVDDLLGDASGVACEVTTGTGNAKRTVLSGTLGRRNRFQQGASGPQNIGSVLIGPAGTGIASVTLDGSDLIVTLGDDTELPPVPLPSVQQLIDDAVQAATDSETAQGLAEDARDAAVLAQGSAEDARDLASGYASSASGSASTASTQAGLAAGSASAAGTAQGLAEDARDAAVAAADDASGYAGTASTQAGLASSAATASQTAQGLAEDARDAAQGFATDASDAAGLAQGFATDASDAKDAAVAAQGLAEGARDAASGFAGTATTQAGLASSAATAAQTAQGLAEDARDTAQGYATTAQTQAGIATTQAGIATTQAGNASTSATNAHNSELAAQAAQAAAEAVQVNALPTGGVLNDVLRKKSGTNYDYEWAHVADMAAIVVPVILTPANGATGVSVYPTFVSSQFGELWNTTDTHASSDWQLATDSGFSTIVASVTASTTAKTVWTVTSVLPANTLHYVRVRYNSTNGLTSAWSNASTFTTNAQPLVRVNGFAWYMYGAAAPDSYYSLTAGGADDASLAGNTGYTRQGLGRAVVPYPQAMMRRCVLKNDGSGVAYYLDCDDSTKIAGTWSGTAQTGWLRVHEGFNDPVRPIPGQTAGTNAGLRALATAWSASVTYTRGDLVTNGGYLWVSLSDANLNITPAAGTVTATLDGSAGQVMVEIPRFYMWRAYDAVAKRAAWDIVVDPGEIKPFPNLSVALTSATTRTLDGLTFTVHPAFQKAGVERSHRYMAAFRGYNQAGVLMSRTGVTSTQSQTRATFRAQARARNTGLSDPSGVADNVWQQADAYLLAAIQALYLTEYRSLYSQAILGGGNQGGSDYAKTCGRSAVLGNASGAFNTTPALVTPSATQDNDGMIFRGIEDLYGSAWCFIDGYNGQGNGTLQQVYLCNTPSAFADDTATNYTAQAGVLIPAGSGAYTTGVHDSVGFYPNGATGGSAATYTTDGLYQAAASNAWYVLLAGGNALNGGIAGVFAVYAAHASSSSDATLGGALAR